MSGSGKLTALKAFEDLGFYAVDNLPIALVPKFADLTHDAKTRRRAALIIDIREGQSAARSFRKSLPSFGSTWIRASSFWMPMTKRCAAALVKRAGLIRSARTRTVLNSLKDERTLLKPIQKLADLVYRYQQAECP